jgi:flagellar basal-body rod protein FlgF
MGSGIYTALSGAVAQGKALDVVAHDVANASTVGFHAQRLTFEEALSSANARATPSVSPGRIAEDTSTGPLRTTGQPLDLAIKGDGYFTISTDRGVRYTRAGAFTKNGEGALVTPNGEPVLDAAGGPIIVPLDAKDVRVTDTGAVMADGVEAGQIAIARFRPEDVVREGSVLTIRGGAEPLDGATPEVASGALEESNFSVVRGMVDLVRVSRTYESLTQMIAGYKEIDTQTANQLKGG